MYYKKRCPVDLILHLTFITLFQTHADKRSHELLRKKEEEKEKVATKEPKKTKKELEEEKRQEGLQKSIDQSNKGFAMLQKMGYKAGETT